ncbi:MAG: hypothetical protein C4K49_10580 [Candidatus Thorarchaeota archaeon]|nr:MAG: hypothetical protein C4K49_10580 [Candidatus Thorarchaeota archaeon]
MENGEETVAEASVDVDTSQYRPVKGKKGVKETTQVKESPVEDPRLMDVRTYLEEDEGELNLHPTQKEALRWHYRGKILPYAEWKTLIHNDHTRRAE